MVGRTDKQNSGSKTVAKAIDLLLVLAEQGGQDGLGLSELCRLSGMNKSSACRLLKTLLDRGFIAQDPGTSRYHLGLKLLELGTKVSENLDLRSIARPILKRLMEQTGETIHLTVLDDIYIVYVDKVQNPANVRMLSYIGGRMPAYSTASGKAMLAFSPESYVNRVIQAGMPARTSKTITDPARFREALQEVRANGYAFDDMENEEGIRCVAAPVFNHMSQVVGAVSISGSSIQIDGDRIVALGEMIRDAGREISLRMGWIPPQG